jgi:histidinol-phosphate/aromatic aminotransferase/cobyric acid decarboxylase-like protein
MEVKNLAVLKELKKQSGSHSPSIETILERTSIEIDVDACFLSNPYATDLFMSRFNKEIIERGKLRNLLEFYPPQNGSVAEYISKFTGVPSKNIFVGNGAIEIIQAVIHRFMGDSIALPIPTFSSYYEFVSAGATVEFYQLDKERNYTIDIEEYADFCISKNVSSAVLINPNNPDGGYISRHDIVQFLSRLSHLECIILDESFIHFAYEDINLDEIALGDLVLNYPNLVVIKSMSKDFGVAGLRAGYSIMKSERVAQLLKTGFLWNLSGLTSYFFKLLSEESFQRDYQIVRKKYIMNTLMFFQELSSLKSVHVIPSKANFALVEIKGKTSWEVFALLLAKGIYVRDCSDKIGLKGNYIRVASRTFEENLRIIEALKSI